MRLRTLLPLREARSPRMDDPERQVTGVRSGPRRRPGALVKRVGLHECFDLGVDGGAAFKDPGKHACQLGQHDGGGIRAPPRSTFACPVPDDFIGEARSPIRGASLISRFAIRRRPAWRSASGVGQVRSRSSYYDRKRAEGKHHNQPSSPLPDADATPSTPCSATAPFTKPKHRQHLDEKHRDTLSFT